MVKTDCSGKIAQTRSNFMMVKIQTCIAGIIWCKDLKTLSLSK